MSHDFEQMSILHWVDSDKHKCGYCGSLNSISYGLWAECLTVDDYQHMIDRGWRRSGKYCYKPIMSETCCPQYTIRCAALRFKPSKSQKKVLRKVNKYLREGCVLGTSSAQQCDALHEKDEAMESSQQEFVMPGYVKEIGNRLSLDTKAPVLKQVPNTMQCHEFSTTSVTNSVSTAGGSKSNTKEVKKGVGPDAMRPHCQKAKFLRQQRREAKLLQAGAQCSLKHDKPKPNQEKTLKDLLAEECTDSMHQIQLRLICPTRCDWQLHCHAEFELYKKYQMAVHNDPAEKCSVKSFEHFLVHTPLQSSIAAFGSFHQQYWLDDKLVAVGVIDILPKCVSSVYFFYDPDFRDLTLGTYSALREVRLTQSLHLEHPSIEYYYMGFYIHACPKMRYKGKFAPSDLLCPETYGWAPIERCLPLLEANKYSRLQPASVRDEELCVPPLLDQLKIITDRSMRRAGQFHGRRSYERTFATLGRILGKKLVASVYIVMD